MTYTIERESRFTKIKKSCADKLEEIFLSTVLFLAKLTKSKTLANFLESFTKKQIQRMQQEITRAKWDMITLEKAQDAIKQ
jgi:hypothetical protein